MVNHLLVGNWAELQTLSEFRNKSFTLFRLQVFFDEGGHILLQFGAVQDLDVVAQAQVEAAEALHLIDISVEIPDVIVALVGLDAVLGLSLDAVKR